MSEFKVYFTEKKKTKFIVKSNSNLKITCHHLCGVQTMTTIFGSMVRHVQTREMKHDIQMGKEKKRDRDRYRREKRKGGRERMYPAIKCKFWPTI